RRYRAFVPLPSPPQSYTLSLHDALPILRIRGIRISGTQPEEGTGYLGKNCTKVFRGHHRCFKLADGLLSKLRAPHGGGKLVFARDRKSTRLNSSHVSISYAVFCLKKKTR